MSYCKYKKRIRRYSDDNGKTWQDVEPKETKKGDLIECGLDECLEFVPQLNLLSGKLLERVHFEVSVQYPSSSSTEYTTVHPPINDNLEFNLRVPDDLIGIPKNICGIFFHNTEDVIEYIYSIPYNGEILTRCAHMFDDRRVLKHIYGIKDWKMSNVTSISFMFRNCQSLTKLNIGDWNVSNVTSMSETFKGCIGLTELNIGDWDVSNVKDITGMFDRCTGLTEIDLSKWKTTSLTDMNFLFSGCTGLKKINISNWYIEKILLIRSLFYGCTNLEKIDFSGWDMNNIFYNFLYDDMFYGCSSLKHIKCSQAFMDWCWKNQDEISLPDAMRSGGSGVWEIV